MNEFLVNLDLFEGWEKLPFAFWVIVYFVFGSIVGSFLNVCIYRMPEGLSVVTPASRCPSCGYKIPWFLNIPIFSWVLLRGKCRGCRSGISMRYPAVEFITGALFAGVWARYGDVGALVASNLLCLVLGFFCSGLVVASFIDIDHFIIPDSITLGGIAVGFVVSMVVPTLHSADSSPEAMRASFIGIAVGGGMVYAALRVGKALFGKKKFVIAPGDRAVFGEDGIRIGDDIVPYEEIFYRKSDRVIAKATKIELPDRCYWDRAVSLSPEKLVIGDVELDPAGVPRMAIEAPEVVIPREAMGFGDVKFMAAIGAFLGWQATVFSLMASSVLGAIAGIGAILIGKQEWSSRIPFGPYIALAAAIWVFGGDRWMAHFLSTGSFY